MKQFNRCVLIVSSSIAILFITVFTFFLYSGSLTFFAIQSADEITLPEITNGTEVEGTIYKYSNSSGIIITTEPVVSCSWKPDHLDDGWKTCEAIFEIENHGPTKPILRAPTISFDFLQTSTIRNMEISYSESFYVTETNVLTETTKTIEQEQTDIIEDISLAGITGRAITEEEQPEQDTEITIVKPEQTIIKKRQFRRFSSIPTFPSPLPLEKNDTGQNTSSSINNTNVTNHSLLEPGTTPNESTNTEEQVYGNDSIDLLQPDENDTLPSIEGELNETTSAGNASEPAEATNESAQADSPSEEETVSDIEGGNSSSSEEETDPSEIEEPTVESEETTDIEQPSETSSDEPSGESELPSSSVFPSGFAIQTNEEELSAEDFAIDTKHPFAIRLTFEIPKYETNQFNFNIVEETFFAVIDPDVSSCGTLNSANSVYTLTQDVSATNTCFIISETNITLDCQGNTINYSSSGNNNYGIQANATNATIRNCNVQKTNPSSNSAYAIYLLNAPDSVIDNTTVSITSGSGISDMAVLLDTSPRTTITNNTFSVSGGASPYGLYTQSGSSNTVVIDNDFNISGSSDSIALYISDSSSHSIVLNNSIEASGLSGYGLFTESVTNTSITNNTINLFGSFTYGLFSESATINILRYNTLNHSGNDGEGISFQSGSDHSITEENTLYTYNTSVIALHAEASSNISVLNNTIETTGGQSYAIEFSSISDSSVANNSIVTSGNDAHAFSLSFTDANTFSENTLSLAGDEAYGFRISSSDQNNFSSNIITGLSLGTDGFNVISSSHLNTFEHNLITLLGNTANGFYLQNVDNNTFYNETINATVGPSLYGIYFRSNTTNNSFLDMTVYSNNSLGHAVYVAPGIHYFSINDSSFTSNSSNAYDFFVGPSIAGEPANGTWNVSNTTLADINWSTDSTGTLNTFVYATAFANHTNGSTLSNVSVTGRDRFDTLTFSQITTSSGETPSQSLLSYKQNDSSGTYSFSNHTFNASLADGSENLSKIVNITTNQTVFFLFGQSGDSGGSGSGSGGGGGGSSNKAQDSNNVSLCTPQWSCTSWSSCSGGTQTRTCTNANPSCDTGRPEESRACGNAVQGNSQRDVLFDINLEIIDRSIPVGDQLLSSVGLINVGIPGRVSGTLSYQVFDEHEQLVFEEDEIVPVETQIEFIKTLDLSHLSSGKYTLFVDLSYEGQVEPAQATESFTVGTVSSLGSILLWVIIMGVMGGIVITLVTLYKLRKKQQNPSEPVDSELDEKV